MLPFALKDSIFVVKKLSHLRVDLLFSLRKEKSKQKRNGGRSEHPAVIFFLHDTNADDADTKENREESNSSEYNGLGIAQKPDKTAEKGTEPNDSQRSSEGLPVRFLVRHLRLVIVVDQIGAAFINGKTDYHEQNSDGEHDNGIEQHNDFSFQL